MKFIAKTKDNNTGTLFDLLAEKTGASATKVRMLIKKGAVLVDGRAALRPDAPVRPGQGIEITEKKSRKAKPKKIKGGLPLQVLYEDEYLLAAQKPAGMLSISTKTENINTFYRAVSDYVKENAARGDRTKTKTPGGKGKIFIVHRLDREVSGVMVFAKSQEVQKALQDSWEKVEKVYSALVEGRPPKDEGTVKGWLCEIGENLMRSCPAPAPGDKASRAKLAVTHYRLVEAGPVLSLLEVRLGTGRKHQIRVHLRDMGCPVVGDKKYGAPDTKAGGKTKNPADRFHSGFKRMGLHAARLSFTHPVTGRKLVIESPAPKGFLIPLKKTKEKE